MSATPKVERLLQEITDNLRNQFVLIPKARVRQLYTVAGFVLATVFGLTWATAWAAVKAAIRNEAERIADIHRLHDTAKEDVKEIEIWRGQAKEGKFDRLTANQITANKFAVSFGDKAYNIGPSFSGLGEPANRKDWHHVRVPYGSLNDWNLLVTPTNGGRNKSDPMTLTHVSVEQQSDGWYVQAQSETMVGPVPDHGFYWLLVPK
jgi:hypothetical protein